jgi:4a-hydroxytetrahydrobiopterin dehydratase
MDISKVKETAPVTALAGKTCTPCKGGVPPLTPQESLDLMRQVPRWELREDARSIERTYKFRDFREAQDFVQRVGELAETEGHHPDIRFGWGYATVSLQTKKIKGLHENDFIMAAKINSLIEEREAKLDEAIAMTFPASDPIAVGRPTGTEAATPPRHKAPASRKKKKQGA